MTKFDSVSIAIDTELFKWAAAEGSKERTSKLTIKTREQFKETDSVKHIGSDTLDDMYRAYRAGYNHPVELPAVAYFDPKTFVSGSVTNV